MADIYGSHFEYGGVSSRNYGLIIVNVQTDRMAQVAGSLDSVYLFDKAEKRRVLADTEYSEFPLTFELDIVTDDERCLQITERREIERWLFNRRSFRKLYLDPFDDMMMETSENVEEVNIDGVAVQSTKRLYLNCRFINPERIENECGTLGWRVTLEADSGLWWQDEINTRAFFTNASSDSVNTFSFTVDTDLDDYTFPRVNIYMGDQGGDITLINNTDDETRMTSWVNIPANVTVTIGGAANYLTYPSYFSDKNFPRMLPGENNFTIKGNVRYVRFRWKNRRLL